VTLAVNLRIPAIWRQHSDWVSQVDLPEGTLTEILLALVEKYPALRPYFYTEKGEVEPKLLIFVNNENIRYLDGMATLLKAGDEVYIIPTISGGS